MHSVTSNAVYNEVITNKKFYFDSNVNKDNVSLRATAIKTLTNMDYSNHNLGGVGTIRYANGYYYTYVWGNVASPTERNVLEINSYGGGTLNIWQYNYNSDSYTLIRTI